MSLRRQLKMLWDDAGRIGVERFGFPVGAVREAAIVATVACWLLGVVLLMVNGGC